MGQPLESCAVKLCLVVNPILSAFQSELVRLSDIDHNLLGDLESRICTMLHFCCCLNPNFKNVDLLSFYKIQRVELGVVVSVQNSSKSYCCLSFGRKIHLSPSK